MRRSDASSHLKFPFVRIQGTVSHIPCAESGRSIRKAGKHFPESPLPLPEGFGLKLVKRGPCLRLAPWKAS